MNLWGYAGLLEPEGARGAIGLTDFGRNRSKPCLQPYTSIVSSIRPKFDDRFFVDLSDLPTCSVQVWRLFLF